MYIATYCGKNFFVGCLDEVREHNYMLTVG